MSVEAHRLYKQGNAVIEKRVSKTTLGKRYERYYSVCHNNCFDNYHLCWRHHSDRLCSVHFTKIGQRRLHLSKLFKSSFVECLIVFDFSKSSHSYLLIVQAYRN